VTENFPSFDCREGTLALSGPGYRLLYPDFWIIPMFLDSNDIEAGTEVEKIGTFSELMERGMVLAHSVTIKRPVLLHSR